MTIWLDAQLSPLIAEWLERNFDVQAIPLRNLGLHTATDKEIFFSARKNSAIIMSKDSDFIELSTQFGSPPQIIWITCGNTSNRKLKEIFLKAMPVVINYIQTGESIVEVTDGFRK